MNQLFILLFLFTLVWPIFADIKFQHVSNDANVFEFNINDGHLLYFPNRHRANLPYLNLSFRPSTIDKLEKINSTAWKLIFDDKSVAEIRIDELEANYTEYNLVWKGDVEEMDREICVHYGHNNASWYNGYHSNDSHWPMDTSKLLNKSQFNYVLELERNSYPEPYYLREFEFVLEHLWVNSDGFAVALDPRQPLYVRRDPHGPVMCFSVYTKDDKFWRHFYLSNVHDPSYHDIKLRLFSSTNIRTVTDYVVHQSKHIPKPSAIPDERFFRYPTFVTGSMGKDFNQTEVETLSSAIINHAFPAQSEILLAGYRWIDYHNYTVNEDSFIFGNFSAMSTHLHSKGFRVGAILDEPVIYGVEHHEDLQHLVQHNQINYPLRFIDLTLPAAEKYYQTVLSRLHENYKMDTFLLRSFILDELYFNDTEYRRYPNLYATKYIEASVKAVPDPSVSFICEFAFKSQHLPLMTRMLNYYHVPAAQLLRELIPNVLSLSIAGYSFIQPYSVGGFDWMTKTPEEQMIRMVQATALMPSMSFTVFPWDYNATVLNIMKRFVDLHTEHASTIVELARDRVKNGHPIVRPMWYEAPDDGKTYHISDQFMLGSDILVAPVTVLGQRERTVYLPAGTWIDQHGKSFQGPADIKVAAPIEELAYFKRKV